ncbi:MAG TPA: glycosyltransferase, partial [Gemmatimonadaceae bacterium]|nr:glycosyltransferase [Gemmatimonadaceae bacterium]
SDLLQAFALLVQRVPRQLQETMRLVIVGGGPERSTLERLATDLGIAERVCFAGAIAHTPALPSLFDVVALSSESEGFPNAVVEAMAAARPVVATAVGGVVDAVEHGVTGLLVPPRSPEAMAEALRAILTQPDQARRMGIAAQQRARERYHVRQVVPRLEEVYLSAVDSARKQL